MCVVFNVASVCVVYTVVVFACVFIYTVRVRMMSMAPHILYTRFMISYRCQVIDGINTQVGTLDAMSASLNR